MAIKYYFLSGEHIRFHASRNDFGEAQGNNDSIGATKVTQDSLGKNASTSELVSQSNIDMDNSKWVRLIKIVNLSSFVVCIF